MIKDSSHGSSWFIYHKYSKSHHGILHENRNAREKSVGLLGGLNQTQHICSYVSEMT